MKLYYHIENNGDGSASARFHPTQAAADKADEELEEGWGEQCSSHVELKLEDGKLFYKEFKWTGKTYEYVWTEAIQE